VLLLDGSRNVLIVNAHAAGCARLARALTRHGCEVYMAHDGESAVRITERERVDRAVLELHLPDVAALKLVGRLKEASSRLRIVVLSSCPSIAMAVEAIRLGAIQYLPTPVDAREVVGALEGGSGTVRIPAGPGLLSLDALVREYIDRVLIENDGNVSAAARLLGMHRRTLQRKLRQRAPGVQGSAVAPGERAADFVIQPPGMNPLPVA
jgi:two-component system response regulator RegA